MRIGFYGGSFDPPHRGHIALALAAADQFSLDCVLLAPVGVQPLKEDQPATDFLHRYTMTALAAQADPRLQPSLLDAPQPSELRATPNYTAPNYTVDTLVRLRAQLASGGDARNDEPEALFTLMGADSFLALRQWREPERLLSLCDWIVAARPHFDLGHTVAEAAASLPIGVHATPAHDGAHGDFLLLQHAGGNTTNLWFLPHLHQDVSATDLRAAIPSGAWEDTMLPAPVAEYIRKTGLYCER